MRWTWCDAEPGDCGLCLRLENRTWPAEAFAIFCTECEHETPALHVYGRGPLVRRGLPYHWNRCLACGAMFRTLPPGRTEARQLERAGQLRLVA